MITKLGVDHYKGTEHPVYLLCGRAARDGELRSTSTGKTVGAVSVKAKESKDGQAMWVSVEAWEAQGRALAALHKGDMLLAVGQLAEREYNGKTYYTLWADFVSLPIWSGGGQAANREALTARAEAAFPQGGGFTELMEDDGNLPF